MKINIDHIAKLAHLKLPEDRKKIIEKQLEETIDYVEKLSNLDTKKIDPTSQTPGLENVFREDEVEPSISQEEALKNAKSKYNGFFKVQKILDNE